MRKIAIGLFVFCLILMMNSVTAVPSGNYYKQITIDHNYVNGSQTDFPMMINTTDTDLILKAQLDGDDITFVSGDHITQLDHEIESYNNSTGQLVAWVRIPSLSGTTDTVINMYYNDSSAINTENPSGVWGENASGVWLMDEGNGTAVNDSSGNNNHGVNDGADWVANGLDFDGVSDSLEVSTFSTEMVTTKAYTFMYSLNTIDSAPLWASRHVMLHDGTDGLGTVQDENGKIVVYTMGGNTQPESAVGTSINDGQPHTVVAVFDQINEIISVYVDGMLDYQVTSYTDNSSTTNAKLYIGHYDSDYFDGYMEDVYVYDRALSTEEVGTRYNNTNSPLTFSTMGAEQASDTTIPVVNTVTLDNTTPNTGDAILVTVNATDNALVTNVTANNVELTSRGENIWNGTIIAIDGTNPVNVSANDAAGNTGWNNSTSYTATTITDDIDPVVNTVTLDNTTPNTGDAILVTVNATDNISVTSVTANDVELTSQGENIWNGTIIAIDGTNSVNVSANDAAGNTGWNNSTSYTATTITTDTTPPVPTDLQNTTGNDWIEYIWSPGDGVTTDGYNVSINGTWFNSTNTYLNVTVGPSGWANITVWAWNGTGNGNISSTNVSDNVQTPAAPTDTTPPVPTDLQNTTGNDWIEYIWSPGDGVTTDGYNVSINGTWFNSTNTYLNVTVGPSGWANITVWAWNGTGNGNISSTNVSDNVQTPAAPTDTTPPVPTDLQNTTGNDWIEYIWSPGDGVTTDGYNVSINGTWFNSTNTYLNVTVGPSGWANITVWAWNGTGNGNISSTNVSDNVQAPDAADTTDPVVNIVTLNTTTPNTGDAILVTVNATDEIAVTSVTANDVELTSLGENIWNGTIIAIDGTNSVNVLAMDAAGNTGWNNSTSYKTPTSSGGSGGSSGGSSGGPIGVITGGESGNVEETVVLRIDLREDVSSTYNFNNVITSVEVSPNGNYGTVAARIEILAGRPSSITSNPPAGELYKYVNVRVGSSRWYEGKFSSSVINFEVPESWLEENNINPDSVTLYRYNDGEWQSIETTMTGQAGGYFQYSSATPGFSTFMILGQVEDSGTVEPVDTPDPGITAGSTPTPEDTSTNGTPGFGILLGIMGVLIAVHSRRK